MTQLPHLIAHYLATSYPSVLPTFLSAAQISPPDPTNPPNPDLRTLVADFLSQQLIHQIEAITIDEHVKDENSWEGWTAGDIVKLPLRSDLSKVDRTIDGISAVNLLTIQVADIPRRVFNTSTASYYAHRVKSILTTSVDKTLKIINHEIGEVDQVIEPSKAPILTFALHPTNPRYIVTGSMDGTTVLTDLITLQPLQAFRSNKFVVRLAFALDGRYLATASYDRQIVIYEGSQSQIDEDELVLDDTDDVNLARDPDLRFVERKRINVESNPEAIVFWGPYLLYTLRESHALHYIHLETFETTLKSFNPHTLDTHVSFAILDLAIHPSGKIIACLTGDHRGTSGERILLYETDPSKTERIGCLWTGSETDAFVLPRMTWLPDGSGLLVTTPNGYINLMSLSGEVKSSLKVHGLPAPVLGQASSEVVRDVCAVPTTEGWEAVSVGYDRMIRISSGNAC